MTKWGSNLQHWMIQDETLFSLAQTKIDELAQNAEPFALVLNTMDTHGPSGFPSPRCGKSRGMIDAVRCADRLIAEFIEEVGDAHPDLVAALLTDHLIGGGADKEVLGLLVPHPEERRLRFVVWGPDLAPGVIDHPGTHFDVMPTLMDVLGLRDWTEHYLGASLLRFESPWFSHDRPLSLRVVHEGLAEGEKIVSRRLFGGFAAMLGRNPRKGTQGWVARRSFGRICRCRGCWRRCGAASSAWRTRWRAGG